MGKQLLVYVIGMSMMISYAMLNMNKTSLDSQDSYALSYGRTMARNIAHAGANIGTQLCLADTGYSTNLLDQKFNGGTYNVYVTKNGDTTRVTSVARVGMRYYDVANRSWQTQILDTVEATLRRISFSKYGYFSNSETNGYMSPTSNTTSGSSMWKITGDSMYGPVHTNVRWNFSGRPYFHNKVTAASAPNLSSFFAPPSPIYNGGYQWGITVPRPPSRITDIENAATAGGKLWTNTATGNQDLGLEFQSDGRVRVKIPWNTGATKDTTYGSIASLAPNGVMGVKGIDLRIWGTYNGKATVFARTGTSTGALKGNVWIQGNLVAADNPQTNINSDDLMGLVAERMAYVTTTGISRTSSSQTTIQAAIYTQNGVFAVENYTSCGVAGRLNLFGGVTMNASTSTNTSSGGVITNGMLKSFRHDPRFLTQAPPFYPTADRREVIAWWEN
jgi:hypothetical protein